MPRHRNRASLFYQGVFLPIQTKAFNSLKAIKRDLGQKGKLQRNCKPGEAYKNSASVSLLPSGASDTLDNFAVFV
jgi:hypothetical protein